MTDKQDPLGLLKELPRIVRARAFRLYADNGKRYLDLSQNGGRGILGANPPSVLLAFKNTASRGLFSPLPSVYQYRFEKILSGLVPGHSAVRWYASRADAEEALEKAGYGKLSLESVPDPALADIRPDCTLSLWRPYLDLARPLPPLFVPVIPLPLDQNLIVFVMEAGIAASFPPSACISPVLLAAFCRSLANLEQEIRSSTRQVKPELESVILSRPGRTLRGPYIRFPEASDSMLYTKLFSRMLDHGFFLPPDPRHPAIIPPDMSKGEQAALISALNLDATDP